MNSKDLSTFELLPKRHWIALGLTCLFIAALLILIPVQQELERRTFAYELPLPDVPDTHTIESLWPSCFKIRGFLHNPYIN